MRAVVLPLIVLAVGLGLWWVDSQPQSPVCPDRPKLDAGQLAVMRTAFAEADEPGIKAALAELIVAEPPIDWLLEGLLDPDRGVREWSAHALGDYGPHGERVIRALMLSFHDKDDYVRWKAARALGNIGPSAEIALPALRIAAEAEQEVEVVRASAQKAVKQIEARP